MSDYIDEYYCKDCNAFFHPGSISWAEHSLKYHNIQYQRIRNKETKMIEKFVIDQFNNTDLIQQSKNTNGALYQRINSLQRDLNIANAEVERLKARTSDLDGPYWKAQYDKLNESLIFRSQEVQSLKVEVERLKSQTLFHPKAHQCCDEVISLRAKLRKIQEAIEAFKS